MSCPPFSVLESSICLLPLSSSSPFFHSFFSRSICEGGTRRTVNDSESMIQLRFTMIKMAVIKNLVSSALSTMYDLYNRCKASESGSRKRTSLTGTTLRLLASRAPPGTNLAGQEGNSARTGSWNGPPQEERAPRVGISSTVLGK